jgi:hypothetical protein
MSPSTRKNQRSCGSRLSCGRACNGPRTLDDLSSGRRRDVPLPRALGTSRSSVAPVGRGALEQRPSGYSQLTPAPAAFASCVASRGKPDQRINALGPGFRRPLQERVTRRTFVACRTHSCHSPFSNCRLEADVRPCDTTHGMARLGLGWMSSFTRVHVSDRDFDVLRQ